MDIRDDHDQYTAARQLQFRYRSRWLVMWGPGSGAFLAFYRGHAHVAPLSAPTCQELHRRILHTETVLVENIAASTDATELSQLTVTRAGR
ncbi:hypothetical protein [Nocardiopsis sp. NRRL B-16309]|uniref:hypothetical protein n=1 Tax=Nocardiopsis sp. NRRL B-16309 TaxID=1519494 RepID=UPI0012E28640|nr:hypothetical protein [Nocardiopsis sp. NRRL B-16309]